MAIGGKNTAWKTGTHGAAATLTTFTSKVKSIDFPLSVEEVEQTVFGSGFREYEASFKNGEISVTYKYDDTIWGQLIDIWNNQTTVNWEFSPDGTASGKPKISGLAASGSGGAVLLEVTINPSVGEALDIETRWRATGQITPGAH